MPRLITVRNDGSLVIAIGSSDKNADWLKLIDKGKHKKEDIQAGKDALRKHKKDKDA